MSIEFLNSKIKVINIFQYNQVKSAVNILFRRHLLRIELTKFEQLFCTGKLFKKTLSKIYALVVGEEDSGDLSRLRWQKEIQQEILQEEWQATHKHIKSLSHNVAIRENYCKLRHRWYLTLNRLHKMYPEVEGHCWRCLEEKGTMEQYISGGHAKR